MSEQTEAETTIETPEDPTLPERARALHNAKAMEWWGEAPGREVAWAPDRLSGRAIVKGSPAWANGWYFPASPELTPELYFWQGGWAFIYDDGKILRKPEWATEADVISWKKSLGNPAGRPIWLQEGRKP